MKINTKQWKKVSADDKYTRFQDNKGNELKIAHTTLSPKMRSELASLPVHLAEGGEVTKDKGPAVVKKSAEEVQKGASSSGWLGIDKYVDNIKQGLKKPQSMANGGEVEEDPASKMTDLTAELSTMASTPAAAVEGMIPRIGSDQQMSSLPPVATEGLMPRMGSQAMGQPVEQSLVDPAMAAQEGARDPGAIDPNAAPSPAPQGAQGLAAAPVPTPAEELENSKLLKAANDIKKGLKIEADAQAAQGRAEAAAAEESIKAQQDIAVTFKGDYDKLNSEYNSVLQDVKSGAIDPDRLWNNKSSFNKVSTIIGLMASGYGAGMQGPGVKNMAMESLERDIDRDIDAQKANLSSKNNMLGLLSQQMGNVRAGAEMMKAMKLGVASEQIKLAAAKSKDPMAQANLLKQAGELDMKIQPMLAKNAAQATVSKLMKVVNNDPSKAPLLFDAMRKIDPATAKDMQGRYVPGIGFANTEPQAQQMIEVNAAASNTTKIIGDLVKMVRKPGATITPADRRTAFSNAQLLKGALNKQVTGGGPMSTQEQELIEEIAVNPTKIFSLSSSNLAALKTLQKRTDEWVKSQAEARGMRVPGKEESMSAQQKVHVNWARQNINSKNPDHALKAKLVLEKLGLE